MMVDEKADLMFDGLFDHIDDLLDFSNEDDFMVDKHDFSSSSSTSCRQQDIDTTVGAQSQMLSVPPLLLPLSLPQDNEPYTNTTPLSSCTGPISSTAAAQTTTTTPPPNAQPLQEDPIDPLDIKQLEWLSDFFEDSFTPSACINLTHSSNYSSDSQTHTSHANNNNKEEEEEGQFRTSSPVSVLEPTNLGVVTSYSSSSSSTLFLSSSASPTSSASSGVGAVRMLAPLSPPEILVVPGRARTKRPRPATFNPRSHIVTPPLLPPEAEDGPTLVHAPHLPPSEPESFAESNPLPSELSRYGVPGVNKKKKKKKSLDNEAGPVAAAPAVRKCMHCEIQKTPQWRAGPMGPKTLCNACGVRYKSGRLFPEYRPAASPTFVPTLHSNSHKKVVEMRNQVVTQAPQAQEVVATKACQLLDYIRRRE